MTRTVLPAAAVLTVLAVAGCSSGGRDTPDGLSIGTVVAGSAATATQGTSGVVETWEVDARLDGGRLEVLTDHEIEGPVAP